MTTKRRAGRGCPKSSRAASVGWLRRTLIGVVSCGGIVNAVSCGIVERNHDGMSAGDDASAGGRSPAPDDSVGGQGGAPLPPPTEFAIVDKQSCRGLGPICAGEDCCTTIEVPGGETTTRSFDCKNAWGVDPPCPESCEAKEPMTVSTFGLDKFEVTVGRFRKFLKAYDNVVPPAGAGAHPRYPETGWDPAWNAELPATAQDFRKALTKQQYQRRDGTRHDRESCPTSWSDQPGAPTPETGGLPDFFQEDMGITCLTHAEAALFCIWDGGRLPTAAESNYAAGGGSENRIRPWGGGCLTFGDTPLLSCSRYSSFFHCGGLEGVGQRPAGGGRWGHQDMVGGAAYMEWLLDFGTEAPVGTLLGGPRDPLLQGRETNDRHKFVGHPPYAPFVGRYSHTNSHGSGMRCARDIKK